MSFLLDTNICSAHIKRPAGLFHRFIQHSGRLYVPTIVVGELYAWAYRRGNTDRLVRIIEGDLLASLHLLVFDDECGRMFGRTRAALLNIGVNVERVDVMIAATAIVHDLTLVTHNTNDFAQIPGLRVVDWLAS